MLLYVGSLPDTWTWGCSAKGIMAFPLNVVVLLNVGVLDREADSGT